MGNGDEVVARVFGEAGTLGAVVGALSGHGARTAVLALREDGVERWTYAELADLVRGLACGLVRAGVERGDRVAILSGNRPE